jgi:hypothetical protein
LVCLFRHGNRPPRRSASSSPRRLSVRHRDPADRAGPPTQMLASAYTIARGSGGEEGTLRELPTEALPRAGACPSGHNQPHPLPFRSAGARAWGLSREVCTHGCARGHMAAAAPPGSPRSSATREPSRDRPARSTNARHARPFRERP